MNDLFYLQDSRSYVGNDVLWWAKDGKGYTTDLSQAHVYTKDEAVQQHNCRDTDIPWPKSYIDQRTRPAVDMQYIRREEALAGTGIKLRKPERPKRQPYKCCHCGKFMLEEEHARIKRRVTDRAIAGVILAADVFAIISDARHD